MKTIAKILVVPVLAAFFATAIISAPATAAKISSKTKTKTVAAGKMGKMGKHHAKTAKGHKGGKKGKKGGKKAAAKKMSSTAVKTTSKVASVPTTRTMHFHKIIRHRRHHWRKHIIIHHKRK